MSTINIGAVYLCRHPHETPAFLWHVGPIQRKKDHAMPLEVTMTNEDKVLVHALPKTASGSPDEVQGDVLFDILSGDCTIGARVDALSVWLHSGTAAADSVVHVSADADLGAGVITIEDLITVHVTDAMAVEFALSAEPPVLKGV